MRVIRPANSSLSYLLLVAFVILSFLSVSACAPIKSGAYNEGRLAVDRHQAPETKKTGSGMALLSSGRPGVAAVEAADFLSEPEQTVDQELVEAADFLPEPEQTVDQELGEAADFLPEPEQTVDQELRDLQGLGKWEEGTAAALAEAEKKFDFPITINRQVEYYLDFFQNQHREVFTRWLSRSGAYLPMIEEELKAAGLPRDLAYLAMIESGFSQTAYSRAKAVGLWQFMKATAWDYELKCDSYVDERRDPLKSTRAAVDYLAILYQEFGSWYLAVAGYNAGEGRIRQAIKKHESRNFWDLAESNFLKLETKRYVPKLIAAIMIAREPEKYGFTDIVYEPPLAYDVVGVPRRTSLDAVALAADVKVEELKKLNRELRKPFTPPDENGYLLKVPVGKSEEVAMNLPRVQAIVKTSYKTHTVKKGESLSAVCKRYGLTKTVILKANNLREAKLVKGQRLRIPHQTTRYELLPAGGVASRSISTDSSPGSLILHKVRRGETVSGLARLYNVPVHLISGWNDLRDIGSIRAGQQLVLYIQKTGDSAPTAAAEREQVKTAAAGSVQAKVKNSQPVKAVRLDSGSAAAPEAGEISYMVSSGDSLWNIADRYNLSVESIRRWNKLKSDIIHTGSRLILKVAAEAVAEEDAGPSTFYLVRGGDSLWTIARKYNISTEEIKLWNKLKSDIIYPGLLLRLSVSRDADV